MASSSPPVKNVALTLYFFMYANTGKKIANPGGLTSAVHVDGNTTEVTNSTLAVVDSTTGLCSIVLATGTMNGDQINGSVSSTDSGACDFTFTIFTVAQTLDAVATDVAAIHTHINDIHDTDLPAVKTDTGTTIPATLAALADDTDVAAAVWAHADGVAVLADTNELQTEWANGGRLDLILDAAGAAGDPWNTTIPGAYSAGKAGYILGTNLAAVYGATEKTAIDRVTGTPATVGAKMDLQDAPNATAIDAFVVAKLKRDWTGITGEALRSELNALRSLRNKISLSGTTMTITKEDDTTTAWQSTITTDGAALPITSETPTA